MRRRARRWLGLPVLVVWEVRGGEEGRTGFDVPLEEDLFLRRLPGADDVAPVVKGDAGGVVETRGDDDGICGGC